jgi:hypothetical protein
MSSPRSLVIAFVGSLITASILAYMITLVHRYSGTHNYMLDSVWTAFWLWLGFTAVRFIVRDVFDARPMKLTLLNIANECVTIIIMSLIIGIFAPALVPA